MKIDYISRAVITAEHATKIQKQNLNQDERKLLLLCCEVFANPRKKVKQSAVNSHQIKALINKLQVAERPQAKQCCLAYIISSLFKNIFNILNLRVGIDRLERNIHQSFNKTFDKTPLSYAYREMFVQLRNSNLTAEKKEDVLQKLESFYLLILKRADFIHAPVLTKDLASLIKKQTGLVISQNLPKSLEDLKNAAAALADQFEKVKRNPAEVKTFFEHAFDSKDVTFEKIFQRISNYPEADEIPLVDFTKRPPFVKQPVKQPPVNQPPVKIEPKKVDLEIDNVNLVLDDENKPKSKDETIFALAQDFVEIQFENYANDHRNYKNMKPWYQAKEAIQKQEAFYQHYANTERFENYLLNEKGILGIRCTDGEFNKENMAEFIENYVDMGMLGKKPKPFVWKEPINIVNEPIINKPIKKEDVAAFEATLIGPPNELTAIYKEIYASWEELSRDIDVLKTIEASFKLFIHKDTIYPKLIGFDNYYGYSKAVTDLIAGAVIHTEHPLEEIRNFVTNGPKLLPKAYEAFKKENNLARFFKILKDDHRNACLEGKVRGIHDYLTQAAVEESLAVKAPAKENLDPAKALELLLAPELIPLVDKKLTKTQNFDKFIMHFLDMQARKYAVAKNIPIDKEWLAKDGKDTKTTKILDEEEFREDYANLENYTKYLKEANIVGKEVAVDPKNPKKPTEMTEEDITEAAKAAKAAMLIDPF